MEAVAIMLGATVIRLEAMAGRLEAISRLEAVAIRLGATVILQKYSVARAAGRFLSPNGVERYDARGNILSPLLDDMDFVHEVSQRLCFAVVDRPF